MKPNDRLKTIETEMTHELGIYPGPGDIVWLINRVKRLTEVLEIIAKNIPETINTTQMEIMMCEIARKALEEE